MNNCNMVKDLMPLVLDKVASEESCCMVAEHVEKCSTCRQYWDRLSEEDDREFEAIDMPPIKIAKQKIARRKRRAVFMAVSIAIYIFLLIIKVMLRPIPLDSKEAGIQVKDLGSQLEVEFNNEVKNFNYSVYDEYDGNLRELNIDAWKVRFSLLPTIHGKPSFVIDKSEVDRIWFTSYQSEDELLYGPHLEGGRLTLPRLAPNYYFQAVLVILLVSLVAYYFIRRKMFRHIFLIALSYMVSHLSMLGISGATYFLKYDVTMIFLMTIVLSIFFHQLDGFYRERKALSQ